MISLSSLADVISDLNVSISDGPSTIWAIAYKGVQLGVWIVKLQVVVFFGILFAFLLIIGGAYLADCAYSMYSGKPRLLASEWDSGFLNYSGFNNQP